MLSLVTARTRSHFIPAKHGDRTDTPRFP